MESEQITKQTIIEDDEISLLDLLAVLLRYKKLIIGTTIAAAIGVVIFSVLSLVLSAEKSFYPNEFTAKSYMLINEAPSSSSSLTNALNATGLGSVAGMAGVGTATKTNTNLATFLVGSNEFLDKIIKEFNLVTVYKIKKDPITNSRKTLKKTLKADSDKIASNVFKIEYTDTDRVLAQNIINFTTKLLEEQFKNIGIDKNIVQKEDLELSLNATESEIAQLTEELQLLGQGEANFQSNIPRVTMEGERLRREIEIRLGIYKQLRQQYELLKIRLASEMPIFQILEYAELPETKSGPSRGMLCIIVTFAAFFLSVFLAFTLNAVENIKKDPEAMNKLQVGKK